MKTKKLFSILMAIVILVTVAALNTIAVGSAQIRYSRKINGIEFYNDYHLIKAGESAVLSVDDITVDGQIPNPEDISYQWSHRDSSDVFIEIPDATEASYTVGYDDVTDYSCSIIVNNARTGVTFSLKKDTLTVVESATPIGELDEDDSYQIYNVRVGDTVSLTADAVSTYQDAVITYEWSRIAIGTNTMPEFLSTTTPTHTFQKPKVLKGLNVL